MIKSGMASSDTGLCNLGFFSLGSELRKQFLSQLAVLSCGSNAQSGLKSTFSTEFCYPIAIPLTSTVALL